ncbi:hypothetical protein TCAL_11561 [Tigriopus californicus]|uniref:Succinate dehydrogenase [ubiquinone] cytochrome b small subunit n=2 Tax=Tigriopus californicus TaxID=6832 RepID=A0A553PH13_TIGCA|nr:hypothetical protein TCAL_11561 [Tigriopus californicus]|eukprot:TCALIF_11561-PA protein Name:"Similar to CG10219 Putative succinate dehydrogenase [ubiquinone] cytochrome b small subunit, mitochondrial (Drosophila melanogaster)" AED:0.01 eAED:0.01 QI:96/1/1/1/0/0/3/126/178
MLSLSLTRHVQLSGLQKALTSLSLSSARPSLAAFSTLGNCQPQAQAVQAGKSKWSGMCVPRREFQTSLSMKSSDHVKLWTAERLVSLGQIPAFILPLMITNPVTDAIFCTLLVLHSHWGIEAIVVDYIRPSLFGGKTLIPNIAQGLVWVFSAVTLGALYYFNYTDVGVVNAIKMLWTL